MIRYTCDRCNKDITDNKHPIIMYDREKLETIGNKEFCVNCADIIIKKFDERLW